MNSRSKGQRGERGWRDKLRAIGLMAHRGQQFCGGSDSPDVICPEMEQHFHPEVKWVEKLNVRAAMRQAEANAKGDQIPYVAHKMNHSPWLVTLKAEDFLKLAQTFLAAQAGCGAIEWTTTRRR